MDREVYVHIGLPKTATTFLQQNIFPNIDGINYIGQKEFLWENLELEKGKNLISHEGLSGNAYVNTLQDRLILFHGLKGLFECPKIIVATREKENIIKSLYSQYIKKGGAVKFSVFRERMLKNAKYDYDLLQKHLHSIFGEKNVYIYSFETFKNTPHKIIQDICKFMSVKVPEYQMEIRNTSLGKTSLFLGRLFYSIWRTEDREVHPKDRGIISTSSFLRGL